MISAKQAKNILEKALINNNGAIDLTATLSASNNYYTQDTIPTSNSINLLGSIVENSATNITWSLRQVGGNVLATGSTLTISQSLVTSPLSTTSYSLIISYTLNNVSKTKTISTQIIVSKPAYVAQLPYLVSTGVTGTSLGYWKAQRPDIFPLTSAKTEEYLSNFFTINALGVIGNIVFFLPKDFGVVVNIMDENDVDVVNEFWFDSTDTSYYAYTMKNGVIPGNYKFKLQFS